EVLALEEFDRVALLGQDRRDGRAGRPAADDDDIGLIGRVCHHGGLVWSLVGWDESSKSHRLTGWWDFEDSSHPTKLSFPHTPVGLVRLAGGFQQGDQALEVGSGQVAELAGVAVAQRAGDLVE